VIEALAPDQAPAVDGALAMARQMLGFSITDDLLPAFGDTWALLDAPAHGGLLLTGTVLVAEVKDAPALQGMLTRIVDMVTPFARENEVTLTLHQTTHAGREIHYVLLGGVPSPVAPAWGYAGGRWVLGLWPQTVAAALQQVDPQTRGPSMLEHPDFKAGRAQLPKEVSGLGYANSRYLARLMFPLLNALQTTGVSMLAPYGGEIDLALLPPVAEYAKDMRNVVSGIAREPDGVRYASIGSIAPLTSMAAGGALTVSVLLPSLARARQLAKDAVSAANLRGIGAALLIHANDHDEKFPANLEDLLESGMVTPNMLRAPRDPDPDGKSYVYIGGQSMQADPRNVLAYERFASDDKIHVLFLDGHVERMAVPQAHAAIRETYTRLGRVADTPSEMRVPGTQSN
jgi:prepilin-type processing-associated H-X9-DG protein